MGEYHRNNRDGVERDYCDHPDIQAVAPSKITTPMDDTHPQILGLLTHQEGPVSIPLDTHPEHAAALGRLLGHWAFLEVQLVGVMQALLRSNQGIARFIWQEFISTRGKITLLRRLNHHYMSHPALKDELDGLLDRASTLNDMRNAYIHALWASPHGHMDKGILTRMRNTLPPDHEKAAREAQSFTPQQIQEDVAKIAALSGSLAGWQGRYTAVFGVPPEEVLRMPDLEKGQNP